MNLQQQVPRRALVVVVLMILLVVVVLALIVTWQRLASLAEQVQAAEAAVVKRQAETDSNVPALQADLRAAQERLAALQARLPRELQTEVFEQARLDAQNSGISEFHYERKGEYPDTLKAGTYKVYRYFISGRGSQDKIIAFLDGMQKGSGPTMIVENIILRAVGAEWQMNADIIVYTLGA